MKYSEATTRQPGKTMYRKYEKLFNKIQEEMISRMHLTRQLEINKFL